MEKPQVDGRIVFYIDGSYGFFDRSRWLSVDGSRLK